MSAVFRVEAIFALGMCDVCVLDVVDIVTDLELFLFALFFVGHSFEYSLPYSQCV